MSLAPSTRLGPYEITAQIGEGGMGQVYRARDTKLDRDVAIKILPEAFAHDTDRLARFQREAKTLASLNHPNIAIIHGLEESPAEAGHYVGALVMELVEGEDLSQRIARGAIPVDEALPIAKQIAEALEAAHEQGIIHRDLKPANVKVRADGTVKVLDFGLAKAMEPASALHASAGQALSQAPTITTPAHLRQGYGGQAMTGVGMILGTAAYMSPEQARGKPVDKRADIWAFGCVLYEMLVARRTFDKQDVMDTIAAIVSAEPDWSTVPVSTPQGVRDLLRRCLEKDARRRLRDIGEARLILEGSTVGSAIPLQPVQRGWRRYLPLVATGAAAALVTALALPMVRSGDVATSSPFALPIRFTVEAPDGEELATSGANDRPVTISPDGRMLAFGTRTPNGRGGLYIRALDSLRVTPLEGTEGATWPFWSPDGAWLAFTVDGQLKAVHVASGDLRIICQLPIEGAIGGSGRGGSWHANGVIVFGAERIYRVPATGGRPTPVTVLNDSEGEYRHLFPSFLPDGQHFLFTADGARSQARTLYVGSLDGAVQKPIATISGPNAAYADGHVLYSGPGATLLAQPFNVTALALEGDAVVLLNDFARSSATEVHSHFAVSSTGVLVYQPRSLPGTRLQWVDRTGRDAGLVAGGGAMYSEPQISPNGQFVAADRFDGRTGTSKIWVFDLARGTSWELNPGMARDLYPNWTEDSRGLVFSGSLEEGWAFFRRGIDMASNAEVIQPFEFPLSYPADVSRSGGTILFKQMAGTRTDGQFRLFMMNPASGRIIDVAEGDDGALSPDDTWLAYSSQGDIFIRSLEETGQRLVVSTEGGAKPRWRADGRELFYRVEQTMMSVAVETGSPMELGVPQALFTRRGWRSWNAPAPQGFSYDAAPDGRRFLLSVTDPSAPQGPMTVIVDWPRLLNR